MEQKYKYTVCTKCITYNHAKYIFDTMNGFSMQETTFPVVTVIIDDNSTDGESEIIRHYLLANFNKPYRSESTEYADVICAKHKTNLNCNFVVILLKYNHYSIKKSKESYLSEWMNNAKYVALCEGDDYWINPKKLQHQVDFMEANDDCSLVFHNAYIEDAETKNRRGTHKIYNKSRYTPLSHIIRDGGFIPTASILYRKKMFEGYGDFPQKCPAGDIKIQTYAALVGKVYYINDVMSVYRLVGTPATHVLMAETERWVEHQNQIIEWYKMVNEYTKHKYEKDIKGAITFSEARIIIAQRKYYKLWNL